MSIDPQIKAAARALCKEIFGDEKEHGKWRCCQTGGTTECTEATYYKAAEAALFATDIALLDGLAEKGMATLMLEDHIRALEKHRDELLATNNRYLERARQAEEKLAQVREDYGMSRD